MTAAAVAAGTEVSPVGFPDNVLASDEKVVLRLRPHWKVLVLPAVALVAVLVAVSVLTTVIPVRWGRIALLVAGVAVVAGFTVWPLVTWWTTHIVLTSHRVILRSGVVSRTGRDIPYGRVNDVQFEQNLFERLLGCGTLTVASASEYGQVVLRDIPRVEHVQGTLYQLVESDQGRRAG